jgi:hypothetical protein
MCLELFKSDFKKLELSKLESDKLVSIREELKKKQKKKLLDSIVGLNRIRYRLTDMKLYEFVCFGNSQKGSW